MNKDMNAIGIVRQMVADGQVSQEVAERYFPELKESEESKESERIRKVIADIVKAQPSDSLFNGTKEKCLDWLEKQGEQNYQEKVVDNLHNYLYGEQKPTWSEEDENRFRNLIYLVEHSNEGKGTKEGFIKFINRLKSLKDRGLLENKKL